MRACLLLAAALLAAAAEPDYSAPGGGTLRYEVVAGDRVTVSTDYWRLSFDLRSGGALSSVVFPHGSGANLLLKPFRTYADGWADTNAPATEVNASKQGEVLRLSFGGRLAAAGRAPGPVEFESRWTLSPFIARADHVLRFLEDVAVSRVGIGSTRLRPELDEYGVRPGPADDPDRRKQASAVFGKGGDVLIAEHHAPLYMILFHRGVEGFDFNTASDLATWESGLGGRSGAGRYEARRSPAGIEVLREPLSTPQPLRVRKGAYTFSYYLGLPRIVEKANRKWRHLSFGNHPWPSDAEIARWAASGVNIVRLHNDYAADGNFWHDGAWPPYDERGMAELRRVIAACHRHRILVVPYFSIHEFHPEAEGYKEHEKEWARTNDPLGTVYHNATGKGEFGAQMCPQSGWLERRKRDIERAYRELGFDGIYYDWIMSLPCSNPAHNAKLHDGADGVIDLLAWTRRLIAPKGVLITHLYGRMPSIAFENFGDLVVNMEEISSAERIMKLADMPLVTVLAESIPRSPCPSYRRDRALERNRNNIAQLAVMGMFPWAGAAGEVYEETLKLFRAFQPYKLEDYRLRDALSGAVRTSWPDVYGALYSSPERTLVVISNTSGEPRKNVGWSARPEMSGVIPELAPYEYRILEVAK